MNAISNAKCHTPTREGKLLAVNGKVNASMREMYETTSLENDIFQDFRTFERKLTVLLVSLLFSDISNNEITFLPSDAFSGLSSLTSL